MSTILRWFGYVHIQDIRKECLNYCDQIDRIKHPMNLPLDVFCRYQGCKSGAIDLAFRIEKNWT